MPGRPVLSPSKKTYGSTSALQHVELYTDQVDNEHKRSETNTSSLDVTVNRPLYNVIRRHEEEPKVRVEPVGTDPLKLDLVCNKWCFPSRSSAYITALKKNQNLAQSRMFVHAKDKEDSTKLINGRKTPRKFVKIKSDPGMRLPSHLRESVDAGQKHDSLGIFPQNTLLSKRSKSASFLPRSYPKMMEFVTEQRSRREPTVSSSLNNTAVFSDSHCSSLLTVYGTSNVCVSDLATNGKYTQLYLPGRSKSASLAQRGNRQNQDYEEKAEYESEASLSEKMKGASDIVKYYLKMESLSDTIVRDRHLNCLGALPRVTPSLDTPVRNQRSGFKGRPKSCTFPLKLSKVATESRKEMQTRLASSAPLIQISQHPLQERRSDSVTASQERRCDSAFGSRRFSPGSNSNKHSQTPEIIIEPGSDDGADSSSHEILDVTMVKRGPVLEPIPSVDEEVPPTDDSFEEELDQEEPNKSEQDKENNIIISLPGMTSRKRVSECF